MGNENSAISNKHGGEALKVVSTEPYVPRQRKRSTKAKMVGVGEDSKQHGKKPLHREDTFTNYIKRAKYKIRSLSNIGGREEQSNPAPDEAYGTNKKENETDQFSNFIHQAKNKLRTVSKIGKNGSFKRG
ncbi:uncharacterized protein LOC133302375 [Gastrolobium bilobum]|uniref:uncharacterized protein LOC133302375 n=1 Tax=Gastrolobium bilobum TaxID=150636 RepID=UPI002AB2D943|nr:uncharacterized protein LOC133302375 [Gastrolobium bilobum]